jgi:TonB family protein
MVRRSGSAAVFFFALVSGSALAFGQAAGQSSPQTNQVSAAAPAAAAAPVMPKDPNELMRLAAQVNGLGGLAKPWHLKADYQTFDADGKPKDKGTFEEWWAGPEKYKISYASTGFNQVEYRNGEKRATTGDAGETPLPERMVEKYFIHPLPSVEELEAVTYHENAEKVGKATLKCIEPVPVSGHPFTPGVSFCFSPDQPLIRLESLEENVFVLFNNIVQLSGHYYLAKQFLMENANQPIVSADITSVDFPPALQDSDLAIPATATFAPPLPVGASVLAGHKISGKDVQYSMMAKQQRIQGTVLLDAVISKTGTITNLQVISGPVALRQSSVDAVKTWKYQPYLLNGEPVEVSTEINVVYLLGR